MPMKRTNYRAPREHRVALIVPQPADLPQVVEANRELLATYDFQVLGHDVQSLRLAARRALLVIPYNCTLTACLRGSEVDPSSVIVLTGHQPELYHPGVWLKNFLAGHLVQAIGGVAINLNVDNDEAHHRTIKAPVIRDGRVQVVEAAYLQPTGGLPYEELGEGLLTEGVADELRQLGVAEPLCEAVEDYWYRLDGARGRGSYARVVTCARHQLERQAGLDNLEALVSDMAGLPQYRCFMLDLLLNLQRFHEAHNGGLRMFRQVHHERNPAQPVPDLVREGPRREMPFWVWPSGQRRQRLWAERRGERFLLFIDGQDEPFVQLERGQLADDCRAAIDLLDEAEARGVKVRPRALTLTLFARVFLGDLFIHGLGGAIRQGDRGDHPHLLRRRAAASRHGHRHDASAAEELRGRRPGSPGTVAAPPRRQTQSRAADGRGGTRRPCGKQADRGETVLDRASRKKLGRARRGLAEDA
ncbi:MAG: hypothetical protein GWP05_11270 [Anaerolineaceae bacterium]|nr:hypothetical protein [Anaerolineaceae bacterium]